MSDKSEKLMIIDGNALIHRSFHALPPTITTKSGEMVNAVYGFATVLLKAIREFKPEYIVLTLDKKGPTFRHKEYKEYKAGRVKAPDELYQQIPRVKELARAFDIPILEMTGFEADDLIGTIIEKASDRPASAPPLARSGATAGKRQTTGGDLEKIIVTGDLDTLQLVDDHTKVYTMSRGLSDSVLYDKAIVKSRYGLAPEQMIDFKALRGDPSDNIPGVRGIGEKTAIELLKRFKTLDGVYENTKTRQPEAGPPSAEKHRNTKTHEQKSVIKPRIIELLKQYKQDAYLSKRLVTIKRDVKIDFVLNDAKFDVFDQAKVVKVLSELEFKSLLPRVHTLVQISSKDKEATKDRIQDKFERNKKMFKYHLVKSEKEFKSFLSKLKEQSQFVFDVETSSLDTLTSELLGISFAWEKGEAYYAEVRSKKFPLKADQPLVEEARREESNLFSYQKHKNTKIQKHRNHPWLENLKPIFEDKQIKKFGHNIKFDIRVMRHYGIDVANVDFDTMVASYLLNPGTRQHNLDALTFTELGHEKITKDDLLGKGKERIGFAEVNTEKLCLYSCEDADFTFRLVNKLKRQLKEQKLNELFYKIEMPLVSVLAKMEDSGIKIDEKILFKMSEKISGKLKQLEKKIYRQAGVEFNINSTQQLREVLFDKLQIPTDEISKTKTGFSTAADELAKLKDLHPIIKLIQEYRELTKLTNTYIDALPKLINKKTKRLHTSFNQTITATGRLSSTEPNLQNIPTRTELGQQIRKAFIAEKGYKLISLDYSQIELRLAAHMSGDKKMIKAFKEGVDIHTSTAAEIYQISPEVITKGLRREAKAINFGILYGQGPHGLSQTADISYARAREFIEQYFTVYKDIKRFIDATINKARQRGYTETLFNRRRYLLEINSSVVQVRKAAERMAINAPLQGTAADMIKVAMIEIAQILSELNSNKRESNDVRMLLQVHDELLFEVKDSKVEKVAQKVKQVMEDVIELKVPVVVDVSVGESWGEMEELEIKKT